jgi:flagellar basal body-associated protein FliL
MKKSKKNKKLKKLDLILIIIGISTVIFTIMMFIFFFMYQSIPDVLCERFYTVIVGELGVAGIIQVIKTICKHKYSKQNTDDKNEIGTDCDFDIEIDTDFDIEENDKGDDLVG